MLCSSAFLTTDISVHGLKRWFAAISSKPALSGGTNFTGKVLQPDNVLPFLGKDKSRVSKFIRSSLVSLRQLAILLLYAAALNLVLLKGTILIALTLI